LIGLQNAQTGLRFPQSLTLETRMEIDTQHLRSWIGRTETTEDIVTATPIKALAATLDRPEINTSTGQSIPPVWHWLYFLPTHPQSQIGPDGHPLRGGFLPPVPLPRRMWAGSRIHFPKALCVGQPIKRVSEIQDVRIKEGRTGSLVFVQVSHQVLVGDEVCVQEEHDIVYRNNPQPGDTPPKPIAAPTHPDWQRTITPDDVLLFRYSALTFNGHRIHYDRRYVTTVEGYPGLVVHGPLIATLLLDLLQREMPAARVTSFTFKAVSPLFDTAPFLVCGKTEGQNKVVLWAQTADGHLAMEAQATTI
jgi:3-methylfumaryl-CoA hydratase